MSSGRNPTMGAACTTHPFHRPIKTDPPTGSPHDFDVESMVAAAPWGEAATEALAYLIKESQEADLWVGLDLTDFLSHLLGRLNADQVAAISQGFLELQAQGLVERKFEWGTRVVVWPTQALVDLLQQFRRPE